MPTLYITRENGTLSQKGDALLWRPEGETKKTTLPTAQISDVIVIGQGNITTQALHMLMDAGIPVHYLTANGRYKGSLSSARGRGFQIYRLQYDYAADPQLALKTAKSIIAGKLLNQRNTLLRYHYRKSGGSSPLAQACQELKELAKLLHYCKDIEQVRGIEGSAARSYFSAFGALIQPPWSFVDRNRRPPKDPVNAMLSFGYTLLLGSVVSAILVAGMDPCVGFVHPEYRGRPSLALDLMEEFRSGVVDRLVLRICGQGQLSPDDFAVCGADGVVMSAEAKKRFLKLYAERTKGVAVNQADNVRATMENHIRLQSANFLQNMRAGSDYLPFILGR